MKYDTFLGGVEPGGLRSKQEIKILICYILNNAIEGLKKSEIISLVQENGIANYFELTEAISELLASKNIEYDCDESKVLALTRSGKMISEQLQDLLPRTVKEKSIKAANKLIHRKKMEQENTVNIVKNDHGYNVIFKVSGGEFDLMSMNLYVPDMEQAKLVREGFYNDPGFIYRGALALLTKNKDLVKGLMRDFEECEDSET